MFVIGIAEKGFASGYFSFPNSVGKRKKKHLPSKYRAAASTLLCSNANAATEAS